jgi:hypothetical protein
MKPLSVLAAVVLLTATRLALNDEPASATQIKYRTAPELGQQSQLVVRGKVVGVRSYWNDNHTKIFTETTVATEETYKGNAGPVVKLTQLGGTVDHVKVTVSGAVRWKTGEEVLLFLEPYTAGTYHVSGFSQGKFTIERDPVTGNAFVHQAPLGDAEMLGAPSSRTGITPGRSGRITLNEFLSQALGQR